MYIIYVCVCVCLSLSPTPHLLFVECFSNRQLQKRVMQQGHIMFALHLEEMLHVCIYVTAAHT